MKKALMFVASVLLAAAPALVSADENSATAGKAAGSKTLQGCLSSGKDGDGLVLHTAAEDVKVEGSTELKDHVGHEVRLTGEWKKETASGETTTSGSTSKTAASSKENGRRFQVTSFEHVSATCSTTKK